MLKTLVFNDKKFLKLYPDVPLLVAAYQRNFLAKRMMPPQLVEGVKSKHPEFFRKASLLEWALVKWFCYKDKRELRRKLREIGDAKGWLSLTKEFEMNDLEYYLKLAGFVQRTKNIWRNGLMQVKMLDGKKLYFSIYDPGEDKELGWAVDESQIEEI